MSKDSEFILTNPWDNTSKRTWYVDTATRTPETAASHISLLFQRSRLSLPVKERVHIGGMCLFMDIRCCSHSATVGQRSQISYQLLARNPLLNGQLMTLSGLPELNSSVIRSRALGYPLVYEGSISQSVSDICVFPVPVPIFLMLTLCQIL